jgi:hypothetical protein
LALATASRIVANARLTPSGPVCEPSRKSLVTQRTYLEVCIFEWISPVASLTIDSVSASQTPFAASLMPMSRGQRPSAEFGAG